MTTDLYAGYESAMSSARSLFGITPSDTAPLSMIPKGVYVGGGGNITLRGTNDSEDTVLVAVQGGSVLPISPLFIRETGTSATFLVGLV